MKARAELEVYRRFAGRLRGHGPRFWPITASNVRVATKKKRALFIFYVPPAIGMIVGCFLVYVKFGGPQVPAVGVQVLERAVPAAARERRRKGAGQQRNRDPAGRARGEALQPRDSAISRLQGA